MRLYEGRSCSLDERDAVWGGRCSCVVHGVVGRAERGGGRGCVAASAFVALDYQVLTKEAKEQRLIMGLLFL